MTSFLKFVVCVISVFAFSAPAFSTDKAEKKAEPNKAEKKDYSEPEFDSLEDTSTTGWKQGTGSAEDPTESKKNPCPSGQIRDSNGKCRAIK